VEWSTGRGHSGFGRVRKIYGQLVQIEQLRGLSATRLPPETKRVVLVPWDYGPDCRTVIWGASARWVTPQDPVVFKATLRPRDEWANGLPTLDVFTPEFSLYPFDTNRLYMLSDPAVNELSLEEVLDLYERLPLDRASQGSPDSAIQPLEAWARSNPGLASRQPARTILKFVRFDAEERRIALIKSPIVGTYRFVVSVPGKDSLVLYARTEERPWSSLRSRYAVGSVEDKASDDSLIGYYVMTAWRKSIAALPRRSNVDVASPNIAISLTPILETPDSTVWRGEASALDRDFDRAFWDRAIRPHSAVIYEESSDWHYVPGFWTTYRDGSVRYRRVFPPVGVPVVTISGERLSTDVMTRDLDR
jgi:hypothetical protein